MKKPSPVIVQADTAYIEGRFSEAEQLYREVVAAEPDNARALELLGVIALWRNDFTNAENYFNSAHHHKSWPLRHWPLNIHSNIHWAILYARAGRYSQAAATLNKAAGPLPFGPFRELKIRAQQLELFAESPPYQFNKVTETTIPFVITDPLPVVQIAVNGGDTVNVFIDTGGEHLILDKEYATGIGAVIAGEVPGEYAGGKKGLTGYGKVEQVELGDIMIRNLPVNTLDLRPTAQTVFSGMDIKGVIGTGLLAQFLATIDYAKQQLVLRSPTQSAHTADAAPGTNAQHYRFPMWLVETHFIFAEGSVNHLEPALMFIDTGLADAGFLASKAILSEAAVAVDWSKAAMGAGGGGMTKGAPVSIDELTLGRDDNIIRKQHIRGVVLEEDASLFKGALGFKVGGLISHQFFRDCAVTFDFVHMQLIVER